MVEYITVRGKKYPIRIGYYVMKKVQEETGMPLKKALEEARENHEIHETILWAALRMGAYAENEELDLKKEDMPMILDLGFMEYMKAFTSNKFFPEEDLAEAQKKLESRQGNAGKETGPKKAKKKTKT